MTVTVKASVPVFPAASDASHVTIVAPTGKLEPEDGEQVGPEVTPTSSEAVTSNVTVLPEALEDVTDKLDGMFMVGDAVSAVASSTFTINAAVLPSAVLQIT